MKKRVWIKIFLGIGVVAISAAIPNVSAIPSSLTLTIPTLHATAVSKTTVGFITIGTDAILNQLAAKIIDNLHFSPQKKLGFTLKSYSFTKKPTKNNLNNLKEDGLSLAIILMKTNDDQVEWGLYEVDPVLQILSQKITAANSATLLSDKANVIADMMWQALTGQEGIFSTKIAYCVETMEGSTLKKQLWIKGPQEKEAQCLIANGKPIAPRWHPSSGKPLIIYSEITPSNVALRSIDLEGTTRLISNFDGINMLPSFSKDGNQMVYCRSTEGATNLYLYERNKENQGSLTQITHENKAHTIYPTLLANGDVIYCSDSSGKPHIYYYYTGTQTTKNITPQNYCTSPTWNESNQKIAYCQLTGSYMQIFTYDMNNHKAQQITFNASNKDDCSWSPCGNYLAFTDKTDAESRVAVLNCISGEQFFITPPGQRCSYPSWSPKLS